MRSLEVQTAVRTALKASSALMAIASDVYDHVPQEAAYPYVQLGEDIATAVDTDDTLDADHLVTVHTWSRYRGLDETKRMQQAIYAALHRQALTVADATFTDCQIETAETFLDDDGMTRHGVQRFRVLIDGVTP